jgi:hypothetical protein
MRLSSVTLKGNNSTFVWKCSRNWDPLPRILVLVVFFS